jgi:hypothetical protein
MARRADERKLDSLAARLQIIRPDSVRRWGTLTAGEMLCHLGDAHEFVLGLRTPPGPAPGGAGRPLLKWAALYAPIRWPKGAKTRAGVDPRRDGTRPADFEADRLRATTSLRLLVTADPATLAPRHFRFGPMTAADWHRWAYRHVDHHLRQFGV